MRDEFNEYILESLQADFLELGYSREDASDLAYMKLYSEKYMSDFDYDMLYNVDMNED